MNEAHLTDDQLDRFTLGAIDGPSVVLVAEHLDACPYCSARAAQLEPLSTVFAHSPDPIVPDDLVDRVLMAAARPADDALDTGYSELMIGGALLAAATLLLALGDWVAIARQAAIANEAVFAFTGALSSVAASPIVLFPLTTITGLLAVAVVAAANHEGGLQGLFGRFG